MSFDLHPLNQDVEPFRINNWGWRPLWQYCENLLPVLSAKLGQSAQYNDGAVLGAGDTLALAEQLRAELLSGRTADYAAKRARKLRALPDEVCNICGGSGRRTDMVVANGCNKCHGDGKVRPSAVFYWFDVETVDQFAAFLEQCGGCTID